MTGTGSKVPLLGMVLSGRHLCRTDFEGLMRLITVGAVGHIRRIENIGKIQERQTGSGRRRRFFETVLRKEVCATKALTRGRNNSRCANRSGVRINIDLQVDTDINLWLIKRISSYTSIYTTK